MVDSCSFHSLLTTSAATGEEYKAREPGQQHMSGEAMWTVPQKIVFIFVHASCSDLSDTHYT